MGGAPRALGALRDEPLHLFAECLLGADQLALDDVGDGGVLAAAGIAAPDATEIAGEARELARSRSRVSRLPTSSR